MSAISKMLVKADRLLRHVDISICCYTKHFAVIGSKASPVVLSAAITLLRYFERKNIR